MRVFRSIAYAHVPDQKWSKLDDKNGKYIFIGYDLSSKSYKLYNSSNENIIICRDVKFDKGVCDWNAQEGNYDISPFMKKNNKQEKVYKRLRLHFHCHLH